MNASYLSVNELLNWTLRTRDGATAGLRDLVVDTANWSVRFLAVEAGSPSRQLQIPPRIVSSLDESRGEIAINLDAASLRTGSTPSPDDLDGDAGLPIGWEEQWRARTDPEEVEETPPTAPMRRWQLAPEGTVDKRDLIRADSLYGYCVETADGVPTRIMDLLVDDSDWSVRYLELAVEAETGRKEAGRLREATSCLVPSQSIDWLNRDRSILYLAVWADELRDAKPRPFQTVGGEERVVRTLNS